MAQSDCKIDVEHDEDPNGGRCQRTSRMASGDEEDPADEFTRLLGSHEAGCEDTGYLQQRQISPARLMLPFLLYCLAVGAVAVPKINVILALLCLKKKSPDIILTRRKLTSDDICIDPAVHAEMGRFVGCGNLISGILCAFSSPRLGKWSDWYGRRPFIALSALGMFTGDTISVLAAWYPDKISVYWILIEFVVGGLTGSFFITVALIQSFATDVTPLKTRASIFSMLHACMYLGLALGPAAGAFFVHSVGRGDMLSVFYVAGTCHALFILYVLLGLPESLPKTTKLSAPVPPLKSNSPRSPKSSGLARHCTFYGLSIFGSSNHVSSKSRTNLLILAAIDALLFGVQVGLPPLLVLFSELQLRWTDLEASLFFSATNITRATILALVLPATIKLMSTSRYMRRPLSEAESARATASQDLPHPVKVNTVIMQVSLLFALVSNLGFSFSKQTLPFTIFGIISAAGAPVSALAQSSMTSYVTKDRVGELFGAISLLHAASRAVLPTTMYFIYSLTLRKAPSALFWVLSVVSGLSLLGTIKVST